MAAYLTNAGQAPTKTIFGKIKSMTAGAFAAYQGSTLYWDNQAEPLTASDATITLYHELLHDYYGYSLVPGQNGVPTSVTVTLYDESGNQDLTFGLDLTNANQEYIYEHILIHN